MQTDADKPQPKPRKEDSAITDYEREQLRDLLQHPGWEVYQKVANGFITALKSGTEAISMNDPLGNADRIAQMWAYLRMAIMFRSQVSSGVTREIEWLSSQASKRTPEQESERRRVWFATGSIGEPPEDWEPRKH